MGGRPLLMTTIERLRAASPPDTLILLVLSAGFVDEWLDMCARHRFSSPAIVEGGATRWESVRNALEAVPPTVDIVAVHDGARPVVTSELAHRVLAAVEAGHQGAIPMVAVTDSIRRVRPDGSTEAVPRSTLRAVQTPQAFRADLLRQAYRLPYRDSFTDDASVMEVAGFADLAAVDGDPANLKVTNPGDIDTALARLGSTEK